MAAIPADNFLIKALGADFIEEKKERKKER